MCVCVFVCVCRPRIECVPDLVCLYVATHLQYVCVSAGGGLNDDS